VSRLTLPSETTGSPVEAVDEETKFEAEKYILAAMIQWQPLSGHVIRKPDGAYEVDAHGFFVKEDPEEVHERYQLTASQIVDVAFDLSLPALFKGPSGRIKTALQLAAIGSLEGGFHKFVEDGDCNKPGFKSDKAGDCDGGGAFSNWQIHIWGGGYVIKDGELTQLSYLPKDYAKDHPTDVIHGVDLVKNRRLAALIAYYLVRYSTHNFHSLCQYAGEPCDGPHPLATQRAERAVNYFRDRPFIVTRGW
jgi:hypothetical protein